MKLYVLARCRVKHFVSLGRQVGNSAELQRSFIVAVSSVTANCNSPWIPRMQPLIDAGEARR